ncbi:MAG: thiamine-phosphate kinase [Thermoplasmata archaeon]|nr:thiamine-phosphate kinase [Thermoplasmata archaeon]
MTKVRRRRAPRLDEREFHRWLRRHLPAGRSGLLPLGDDAAALPWAGRKVLLLSSDALIEGTHFLPATPPRALGEAAANVNLSDIAAKGGTPRALLVDLLLPPTTSIGWGIAVVEGIESAAARWGAHVVGGDTKPSRTPAVVVTVVGVADREHLAPRSGARPRDLLVVTGPVGRGGASALPLRRGRLTEEELRSLVDVHPRVREGPILARYAHAMIDTSDGIADAAHLLAEASGMRLTIDAAAIPITPRLHGRLRGARQELDVAFYGGDYELLAALPPKRLAIARRRLARLGCPLTVVGVVAAGRGAHLQIGGRTSALPRAGWRPFG